VHVSRILRHALTGLALAVVVYVTAVLWVDATALTDALDGYTWRWFWLALGLSAVNYLLRFAKWELCLSWVGVRNDAPGLTRARSFAIYLAGLSMSITPGKLGEVLRSALLRATVGISFARTAPIVVIDRLSDVVALVLLALTGLARVDTLAPAVMPGIVTAVALVAGAMLMLGSATATETLLRGLGRVPGLGALKRRAADVAHSSATLLRPHRMLILCALSVLGWGLECVGYLCVLHGFALARATLETATFLWSSTTLLGALSFLPGGLGATEASLAVLSASLVALTPPVAMASTMLIRAATLWFGELVGAVALAVVLRDPSVRARTHMAGPRESLPDEVAATKSGVSGSA